MVIRPVGVSSQEYIDVYKNNMQNRNPNFNSFVFVLEKPKISFFYNKKIKYILAVYVKGFSSLLEHHKNPPKVFKKKGNPVPFRLSHLKDDIRLEIQASLAVLKLKGEI